ncbi:MAG: YcgL domain-containing protein [Xanthomonadales bacterium]
MNCRIFRSEKKDETYLFLAADQSLEELPEDLRKTFGEPVFVMALKLSSSSKLARVETQSVLESLHERGYFLQLPPKLPVEEEITKLFS